MATWQNFLKIEHQTTWFWESGKSCPDNMFWRFWAENVVWRQHILHGHLAKFFEKSNTRQPVFEDWAKVVQTTCFGDFGPKMLSGDNIFYMATWQNFWKIEHQTTGFRGLGKSCPDNMFWRFWAKNVVWDLWNPISGRELGSLVVSMCQNFAFNPPANFMMLFQILAVISDSEIPNWGIPVQSVDLFLMSVQFLFGHLINSTTLCW